MQCGQDGLLDAYGPELLGRRLTVLLWRRMLGNTLDAILIQRRYLSNRALVIDQGVAQHSEALHEGRNFFSQHAQVGRAHARRALSSSFRHADDHIVKDVLFKLDRVGHPALEGGNLDLDSRAIWECPESLLIGFGGDHARSPSLLELLIGRSEHTEGLTGAFVEGGHFGDVFKCLAQVLDRERRGAQLASWLEQRDDTLDLTSRIDVQMRRDQVGSNQRYDLFALSPLGVSEQS